MNGKYLYTEAWMETASYLKIYVERPVDRGIGSTRFFTTPTGLFELSLLPNVILYKADPFRKACSFISSISFLARGKTLGMVLIILSNETA